MPPAGFWMYVSAEQRRQISPQHKRSETFWPGSALEQRPMVQPESSPDRARDTVDQPRHNSHQHTRTETVWPSVSPERWPNSSNKAPASPYGDILLSRSRDKAVLRTNVNKGNVMKVGKKTSFDMVTVARKRSYEHMRKESQVFPEVDYGRLEEPGHKWKDSRTLVKQRQPWDPEPRAEGRKKASF